MRNFKIQAVFIVLLFWAGCEGKEQYVGKYLMVPTGNQTVQIELELKADGQGSWATDTDNVSFRWDVIGGKLLLHTRTGGVIEGEISGHTVSLRFPVIGTGSEPWIRLRKQEGI